MPSKFPWTKSAPAQQAERVPTPEPQRHYQPPRQYPEAYYDQDLRVVTHGNQTASTSQPSTRSNSAFGIHTSDSLAGQPYEQQQQTSSPTTATSSQQAQLKGKSFKTRLGLSSREELQDTLKEPPAPKGIFGRKKSVVRRKEAPSISRQSSAGNIEREGQASRKAEAIAQPPLPNEGRSFEPYGPDFTREQLKGHQPGTGEPQPIQYKSNYPQAAGSSITSSFPQQAQYQIFHHPATQEPPTPQSQPPYPSSRRTSIESSVISHRHSQGSSSRPSSQQSHNYPPLPSQQQIRAYEQRQQPQPPRSEDIDVMPPPRQQHQSQAFDPTKLSSPGGPISRENSMHPNPLRGPDPSSSQISHTSPQEPSLGRRSPSFPKSARDMSDADIDKLIKDHTELRAKYNNVKRQYFEKKDQVEGLQDSLAHQRLSQSRTCLDDGEYIARMSRLDGLVAQLAFTIRKDWKSIPEWLAGRVNRDAVQIGKQEMIAVGRAVISRWLATEIFDKYFHPGLEPELSVQLKQIQRTIWMSGLPCHTAEDEETLISKIITWRLTTADGLRPILSSTDATSNRQLFTSMLTQQLLHELHRNLDDQLPTSSIESGVTMIVELAVGILSNLPLESRDVSIEYFPPGYPILPDLMKLESGIPALDSNGVAGVSDGDRTSADSPSAESYDGEAGPDTLSTPSKSQSHEQKKGGFLGMGGGGGSGKKTANSAQKVVGGGGGGQQAKGKEEEGRTTVSSASASASPSVRLCVFLGVQIRGKMVLVKAPVYRA